MDPRGVKTTYEYDLSGRLQAIKDGQGKTVENYEYHFMN
jgi:YD repeat-containing protein